MPALLHFEGPIKKYRNNAKKVGEILTPKERYDISKLGGYQRNQQEKMVMRENEEYSQFLQYFMINFRFH